MLMGLVDLSLSRKPLLDGQQNRQVGDDRRDRINYPVEPSSPKVLSAMREILNFVTANLPHSPARILEVGCGTGDLALATLRGFGVCSRTFSAQRETPETALGQMKKWRDEGLGF
jgi:protein-L-isoaspartate O-methyltransferase